MRDFIRSVVLQNVTQSGFVVLGMATHSSILAWRIPWTEEAGGLQSMETQKTWVRSLGQEDPLEEVMATYSNILAWRLPWTGEPGRLQSRGSQRVGHD